MTTDELGPWLAAYMTQLIILLWLGGSNSTLWKYFFFSNFLR